MSTPCGLPPAALQNAAADITSPLVRVCRTSRLAVSMLPLFPLLTTSLLHHLISVALARRLTRDGDDFVGARDRQGPQQQRIGQAEDRGIRADADGEGTHGSER